MDGPRDIDPQWVTKRPPEGGISVHQYLRYSITPPAQRYTEIISTLSRRAAYRSWFHCFTRLVTAPPVAVRPPSTTNCPPVVLEARSEQRKSTMLAISSTVV